MNILFIASDNSQTSGAFLCMVKLCQLLRDEHGCNVIVVLPGIGNGKPLLDEIRMKTYTVKSCTWAIPNEWGALQRIKFAAKMVLYNLPAKHQIRQIIRQEKIDIVHMNTSWTYAGAKAALKENVKLVWHLREALEEGLNRHIVFKKSGYQLIKKANIVITVSDFIFCKYKQIVGPNLTNIYEGLDETEYCRKRKILCNPAVNILCIGLIVEKKGQWQVIEACKILKQRGYANFRVSIVGRGQEEYIQKLRNTVQQYHLEKEVLFCGSTSNPDSYYQNADIMIMSSKAEAFGRTTIEAMMEGCLVIGADAGATSGLLGYGKYGLLFPYGNVEELADRIAYAIDHREEMRTLAETAQTYALKNFTARENAKSIFNVYQKLYSE